MDNDDAIKMQESNSRLVSPQCVCAYSKRGLIPPVERMVKPSSTILSAIAPDSILWLELNGLPIFRTL